MFAPMVLVEGNCPISTPGNKVEPFNAAVSGSNIGKLVSINKSLPYKANVTCFKNDLPNTFLGNAYSTLTSLNFKNEASNELDSTLALR